MPSEFPLSFPQFVMWFQHQQAPSSAVGTVGFVLRASGPMNVEALRHAVQALADRHPMLRTTYHLRDGVPVQRVESAMTAALDVLPYADSAPAAIDEPTSPIAVHIARSFDLEKGPVFRVALFTDSVAEHTVLVTAHHIAADGWSTYIMMSELVSLYGEAAENQAPALTPPALSYDEFVRWQAAEVEGAGGERQWEYWRRVLVAPRERCALPAYVARPKVPRFVGSAVRLDLSIELVQRVKLLAASLRTTPFVVLMGAFQTLVARLCGVRDIVTGMPARGRPKPAYLSVVGNFINLLPVRMQLDETASVCKFLAQLHTAVVDARRAQYYPLARIVQRLKLSGEQTGQALFNTSFTVVARDAAGGMSGRQVAGTLFVLQPLALQAGLVDLGLDIVTSDDSMLCIFKYSLDAMTPVAAADFAQEYVAVVESMTDAPDQMLSTLLAPSLLVSNDALAALLIAELAARDIVLTLEGEHLRVNTPKGALDDADRDAIVVQRPAIVALLRAAAAAGPASDFWRGELLGVPAILALPTDRPRADRLDTRDVRHEVTSYEVPNAVMMEMRRVAEANDASLLVIMMAAWQVLLHRYCGQDDLLVATSTLSGESNDVVPVRGRLGGNPSFEQFLSQIRITMRAAHEHGAAPVARCQTALYLDQSMAVAPTGVRSYDGAIELALVITVPSNIDAGGAARFDYRFATDLFDMDTIERLHENFQVLLGAVGIGPGIPLLDLDILGPTDQLRCARDGGFEAHDEPGRAVCVHHMLEESAKRHADRVAVSDRDGKLRYQALDHRANQLANFLLEAGLGRGLTVAVCLERTVNIPVALAAVLKAGAAYVPLDPAHPRERLRGILRDARVSFFITQDGFEDIAADMAVRVIRLDGEADAISTRSIASPGVAVDPHDLAYVIYTSGSTGRPKGVEVEHCNLVAFLEAMRRQPGLSATDVLVAVTTVAFDIAGLEIWLPLSVGARIVLATREESVDGVRLAALLESHEASVLQATPATWRLLLESGWVGRPTLRALCGGEALPQAVAARLLGRVAELWNLYGPTETTIWSTAGRVSAASLTKGAMGISIGRPIAGTVVRIEDRAGKLVPSGVGGELLIGGAGVARGYRDQPDLSVQAFVTRSMGVNPARFYRTGDMARFRAEGQLEFLGRCDYQIKLRGHRIEPGEIEAVLDDYPGVTGSVVAVKEMSAGDERLVAYLTLVTGVLFDPDALQMSLRARLPEYMVPRHCVVLPVFPLTPNGKVDRNALPSPDVGHDEQRGGAPTRVPAIPMTAAQRRVAALWKEVLQVGLPGLNDNFFDIGGHSLLVVKLQAGLKREFGCDLPLVQLFQHTTIAQQARVVESSRHA